MVMFEHDEEQAQMQETYMADTKALLVRLPHAPALQPLKSPLTINRSRAPSLVRHHCMPTG